MERSFTVRDIKQAISKHNKELDNDIKIRIKNGVIHFTSAKAEQMVLQERMKHPPKKVKKQPTPKPKVMKGQLKLSNMVSKK